jgi:hypothetical protein
MTCLNVKETYAIRFSIAGRKDKRKNGVMRKWHMAHDTGTQTVITYQIQKVFLQDT